MSLIEQAERMSATKRLDAVQEIYACVRSMYPNHTVGYLNAASALIDANRYDDALTLLAEGKELFPMDVELDLLRSKCYSQKGCVTKAYEVLKEVLPGHEGDARLQLEIGELATRLGRWEEAVSAFTNFHNLKPGSIVSPNHRRAILNTYGILMGCSKLPNIPHVQLLNNLNIATEHYKNKNINYLFVSGMPRSGTTALGDLLNCSDDVALFVELWNEMLPYSECSFSLEGINEAISWQRGDENIRIRDKLNNVKYIGDKRPYFFYNIPQTLENLKYRKVDILHILRNVKQVCFSYQMRSENPHDIWDRSKDVSHCVHELNIMHRFIIDQPDAFPLSSSHRILYVDYEKIFRDVEYAINVFCKLGLNVDSTLRRKIERFTHMSSAILSRRREISSHLEDEVISGLDIPLLREVEDFTGVKLL